jgi:hypothetical protein
MATGRSEWIEQTRASAAVNADSAVATFEFLQHITVCRERQDPRAQESVRRGGPGTDDREQPHRGRCAGRTDHDLHTSQETSPTIDRKGPLRGRDHDPPRGRAQDHLRRVNPSACVIGPPRKTHLHPAAPPTCVGRVENQQPRRLHRSDKNPGPRAWARDSAIHTGRSEKLRPPRHTAPRLTNDGKGRCSAVTRESSRSSRRPDEADPGQHEHRRPGHRQALAYDPPGLVMTRSARQTRQHASTRDSAGKRIIRTSRDHSARLLMPPFSQPGRRQTEAGSLTSSAHRRSADASRSSGAGHALERPEPRRRRPGRTVTRGPTHGGVQTDLAGTPMSSTSSVIVIANTLR